MGTSPKDFNKEISVQQIIEGLTSLRENLIKTINNDFDEFQNQYNNRNNNEIISFINKSKQTIFNQLFNEFNNLEDKLKKYEELKNNKFKNTQQSSKGQNFNIRGKYIKINNNCRCQKIETNIKNSQSNKIYGNIPIPKNFNDLEVITSKDIQDENKIITIKLHKKALKQVNDNDEISNKTVAIFLKDVAYISRQAFNQSKEICKSLFDDFQKLVIKKNKIQFNYYRRPFSSWVKYIEKKTTGLYDGLKCIKVDVVNKKSEIIEYMKELFYKLSILYFHCHLSFPPIEIDFNPKSKEFDYESMIDILNNGKGEIHFTYLPALFSNENYLENAKLWVYMKTKDSYGFNNSIIEQLDKVISNQ